MMMDHVSPLLLVFRLRYQKDRGEYRLTLSYRHEPKHYIVSYKHGSYFIENGPNFESLIEVNTMMCRIQCRNIYYWWFPYHFSDNRKPFIIIFITK